MSALVFLPLKLSAPSSEDSAKHKPCRKSTCCCLPRHAGSGHACLLVPASVLQGASSELVVSSTGSLQSVSCQKPNPPLPPVARLVNLHAVGPDKLWDIEWRPLDVTACLLLCPVVITTNDSRCCQIPAGEQDCPVGSAALEILLYFTSLLQGWGWRLDSFLHLRHDEAVQSLGVFIWPCWMSSRAHGPTEVCCGLGQRLHPWLAPGLGVWRLVLPKNWARSKPVSWMRRHVQESLKPRLGPTGLRKELGATKPTGGGVRKWACQTHCFSEVFLPHYEWILSRQAVLMRVQVTSNVMVPLWKRLSRWWKWLEF